MHNAALIGDLEELKLILSKKQEDLELFKASLDGDVSINKQDEHGRTPLHYAVLTNQKMIIELLLSKEISIPITPEEAITIDDNKDECYRRLYQGVYGVVRKLKIDINIMDNDGHTPLNLAVLNDKDEALYDLLRFMIREIEKLFLTPTDDDLYEVNEDEYESITLEYQKTVIQSFINNCQNALPYARIEIKKLLEDIIAYFKEKQSELEEHAKDPRYTNRMNQGVIAKREIIFLK